MQTVVLDSTAFYPYTTQRTPQLERLFFAGQRGELRLCVPEVVVRETTRHFSRQINTAYRAFTDAYRAAKLAGTLPPELDLPFERPRKDEVVQAYDQSLRDDIRAAHGRILPVPEVEHEWVLSRIFGPLKPSKIDQDSYRDILIWKTVVALAAETPQSDVIFITKNTKDFATAEGNLHQDLIDDLVQQGLRPDSVQILPTPYDYVQSYLQPGDDLRAELHRLATQPGRVRDNLELMLAQGLEGNSLEEVDVRLPAEGYIADTHIESVTAIDDVTLVDLYEVGNDELICSFTVQAQVDVSYAVTAPTGHDLERAPRWAVDGEETGAPFLMNTETRDLELQVDVQWQPHEQEWGEVTLLSGHQLET